MVTKAGTRLWNVQVVELATAQVELVNAILDSAEMPVKEVSSNRISLQISYLVPHFFVSFAFVSKFNFSELRKVLQWAWLLRYAKRCSAI